MMGSRICSDRYSLQSVVVMRSRWVSTIWMTYTIRCAARSTCNATTIIAAIVASAVRVMCVVTLSAQIRPTVGRLKSMYWCDQRFATDSTWRMSKIETTAWQRSCHTGSAKATRLWSFVDPKMHAHYVDLLSHSCSKSKRTTAVSCFFLSCFFLVEGPMASMCVLSGPIVAIETRAYSIIELDIKWTARVGME